VKLLGVSRQRRENARFVDRNHPKRLSAGLIAAMRFGQRAKPNHGGAEHLGPGTDAEPALALDIARIRLGAQRGQKMSSELVRCFG